MKPTTPIAVASLELEILSIMDRETPPEYRGGYFFPFRFFEDKIAVDREVLRGFLRSLRNRGVTEYGTGFTDEGLVNGAGYTITPAGFTYLAGLLAVFDSD